MSLPLCIIVDYLSPKRVVRLRWNLIGLKVVGGKLLMHSSLYEMVFNIVFEKK